VFIAGVILKTQIIQITITQSHLLSQFKSWIISKSTVWVFTTFNLPSTKLFVFKKCQKPQRLLSTMGFKLCIISRSFHIQWS